ncbi:hypothetical protein KPL78_09695 [Roseomonas sp. HJA6]|uniref:Uncharacterized protein n=1 Tax=Roseomonas alba TaxID=2846776 RepID=A0ABS7AAB0_9PROT|nr:hypothetical protein [Neoroseomonas alba]MBW6398119.1 hypothetical protein [Neoroseomonas alba]
MKLLALFLALAVAGCGARTAPGRIGSGPQYWRPAAAEEPWRISGYLDTRREWGLLGSSPKHEIVVTVNGRVAMQAEMPRDEAIEIEGKAEGRSVSALCTPHMVSRATLQVNCLVLVANERAATLSLVAGTNRPRA